jgi:cobalamin biosynthetic protein CobC
MVVDEAFADFEEPSVSLAASLPEIGLIVLRSFSKPYGLGGVRLGFALARAGVAEEIRRALGPWPISGPAIEIGKTALQHSAWRDVTRNRLVGEAARLDKLLKSAGLKLIGGTLLFRLFKSEQAEDAFKSLGAAGIFVRRFNDHPEWLRFGIPGDEDAWQRLERALT